MTRLRVIAWAFPDHRARWRVRRFDQLERSGVLFVALADADMRHHAYPEMVARQGFVEVDFGGRASYERYRLFERQGAR